MEIEELIRELLVLTKKKPLRNVNLTRAKKLMISLKEMGFTNREISDLIDRGWSETSVKNYTRGTTVTNPGPRQRALQLLTQLVKMDLILDDVEFTINLHEDLKVKKLSFKEISSLLEEAARSRIDVKNLLQMHTDLVDAGVSLTQLKKALPYQSELEVAGITINSLKTVLQVSEKYGGYIQVLTALNTYTSLKELETEVNNVSIEKDTLMGKVGELKSELMDLEQKKVQAEEALDLYTRLRRLGFNEASLKELTKSTRKYGGARTVLEAVNIYTDLETLTRAKQDVESELKKVQADHAHLQSIIHMCDTLLYELNFSVPAITQFYEIAKKYGEPIDVMKAVEQYGEVQALEKSIKNLSTRKNRAEARIYELENQVQDLRAIHKELKQSMTTILKPLSTEISSGTKSINDAFTQAVENIEATYQQSLTNLQTEYKTNAEKLGELKTDAGKFEDELRLARIINAMIKYPIDPLTKEIPLGYTLILHNAILAFCIINNVNPKIRAGEDLSRKYGLGLSSSCEIELLDLLNWSRRGVESVIKHGL